MFRLISRKDVLYRSLEPRVLLDGHTIHIKHSGGRAVAKLPGFYCVPLIIHHNITATVRVFFTLITPLYS